ncbi:Tetratricopeptide-like helical domain [Phytophthora cactorum]|nr:Tetratricopeptide-like helical domain [Phytophthora cactorum]
MPLYAVVDVLSPTTAVLKTPYRQDFEHTLDRHVASSSLKNQTLFTSHASTALPRERQLWCPPAVFDIAFVRDESCPLESLLTLKGAVAQNLRHAMSISPPAFGVDSVKFSRLLYEANIQPKLLSIGDAAFLFASNLTPGFTYEMDFDGFVRAVEWLAQQFYSDNGTSLKRRIPGIQHTMLKWRRGENARDRLMESLRRFCFETLVHLPCLASTWLGIMESWRLARKQQLLGAFSGTSGSYQVQSFVRGRKRYLEYQRILLKGLTKRMNLKSSTRSMLVSRASCLEQQIDQFISEETERRTLQLQLELATDVLAEKQASRSTIPQAHNKQVKTAIVRDSVAYPVLKPNIMLLAFARRLFIVKDAHQGPVAIRCYADLSDTSLGKLVFKGAVRSELVHDGELTVQCHIVRVLEWVGTFKVLMYTPATSTKRRYDLDAAFILTVLQFSRFQSMRLSNPEGEEESEEQPVETQQFIPHQLHRILNGPHKLLALQSILSYVSKYGLRMPTYSMMPHLVVKVQSNFRRHLARKIRLQLALASYSKQFDRERGRFVYIFQNLSGERFVLEHKPFSLFDHDVPLPPDEWQLVDNDTRFFNPRRGVFSRFNDTQAATVLQRWYRGKMWHGINNWSLRQVASALRYHSNAQKPSNMNDPGQLEHLKRYALQLHVLEHQNFFRWALLLQPKNPHILANYAVYLQCVHLDIDKAELLYRRALDLDPTNDLVFSNFQRLQSERAPGRLYAFAGPGTITLAHSSEIRRWGSELQWREMEDPAAQPPMPKRFFHNLRTGKCTWDLPTEEITLDGVS